MGLSSAQWRLLIHVLKEERVTQARLAERLEIEPISVSRLIDRMEQAGWVMRETDPNDRRVRLIVAIAPRAVYPRVALSNRQTDRLRRGAGWHPSPKTQAALIAMLQTLTHPICQRPSHSWLQGPKMTATTTDPDQPLLPPLRKSQKAPRSDDRRACRAFAARGGLLADGRAL